ncbi:MAG: head-tail adaptor protein [Paracoccus sp. (in: a-proteobacteria)]|uniref:head-tail adaptor protein n=1 Tax=Paracoccus sp. TaxID=267 RepID=UPI0026DF2F34|nr:head-tail adaptor protein [Paracoccus sp. (in: a-proteobacteria)]MDO5613871.1 head-tail adaptor protein [Paracoccus sp. (in: a-proteobacteria)]
MAATPRLTVPLVLEARDKRPDGMGGFVLEWRPLGRVWAEMKSGAGAAARDEIGPVAKVGWRITLRGAGVGDPRRPAAGQRLRMGQRLFAIQAVAERDMQGRWLTCFATEEDQT